MLVEDGSSKVLFVIANRIFELFPAACRILLPPLLEIYVSTILLSDAQRHCASDGSLTVTHYRDFPILRPIEWYDSNTTSGILR
jgi:hypothetical protein